MLLIQATPVEWMINSSKNTMLKLEKAPNAYILDRLEHNIDHLVYNHERIKDFYPILIEDTYLCLRELQHRLLADTTEQTTESASHSPSPSTD